MCDKLSNTREPFCVKLETHRFVMTHLIVSPFNGLSEICRTFVRTIGESICMLTVADEAVVHIKGTTYQNLKSTRVMSREFVPKRPNLFSSTSYSKVRTWKGYSLERGLYQKTIGFAPRASITNYALNCDSLNKAVPSIINVQRCCTQKKSSPENTRPIPNSKHLTRKIVELCELSQ
jgi:hypothetical protein